MEVTLSDKCQKASTILCSRYWLPMIFRPLSSQIDGNNSGHYKACEGRPPLLGSFLREGNEARDVSRVLLSYFLTVKAQAAVYFKLPPCMDSSRFKRYRRPASLFRTDTGENSNREMESWSGWVGIGCPIPGNSAATGGPFAPLLWCYRLSPL